MAANSCSTEHGTKAAAPRVERGVRSHCPTFLEIMLRNCKTRCREQPMHFWHKSLMCVSPQSIHEAHVDLCNPRAGNIPPTVTRALGSRPLAWKWLALKHVMRANISFGHHTRAARPSTTFFFATLPDRPSSCVLVLRTLS